MSHTQCYDVNIYDVSFMYILKYHACLSRSCISRQKKSFVFVIITLHDRTCFAQNDQICWDIFQVLIPYKYLDKCDE